MSTCKACDEDLVFVPDDLESGTEGVAVPDDLELRCGCHYHWQCLMDESASVALTLKCPSCDSYLPVNSAGPSTTNIFVANPTGASIRARYNNEGGIQPDLDILPAITEEAYIMNHPETRPARALQLMCSEGDVDGIVDLLSSLSGDGTTDADLISTVGYQDPLSESRNGLHLAVQNGQRNIVLLLLWLCSPVPSTSFPDPARQMAESMGLGRLTVNPDGDIRKLEDDHGLTAGQLARRASEEWRDFIESGLL